MLIALIYGGSGTEADVSRMSVNDFKAAIQSLGHSVAVLEFNSNILLELYQIKPDLVFNGMYGEFGEDGRLSAALDIMKIPYTHSSFDSSCVAFSKKLTKNIMKEIGLPTKDFIFCTKEEIANGRWKDLAREGLPNISEFFIKPVQDGSSVDAFSADFNSDFSNYTFNTKSTLIMIEERIKNPREVFVVILDNKAIGMLEVKPKDSFYSYESKYQDGRSDHVAVEGISSEDYRKILNMSEKLHQAIGLNCISRLDLLIAENGTFYFSEINNNPGCTRNSIVPDVAKRVGIAFENIVDLLIKNARYLK